MANLSAEELREAIVLLAERTGYARLYDRLVRLNAFVSRRKPPAPENLADRLYSLTAGLRRQIPATLAFHTVWAETFTQAIGEEDDKKLEAIAERINATLTADERAVQEGKVDELAAAIDEYERILAAAIGPRPARCDMLLKAVTPVAAHLRARPLSEPAPAEAPATPQRATGKAAPGRRTRERD